MGNRWRRAIAGGALTVGLLSGGLACGSAGRTVVPVPAPSHARTVIPVPAPTLDLAGITSITPSGGPPGTRVTLTGPDLNAAVTVCFGPQAAAGIRKASSTQLSAIAPHGTGHVPVIVITRTKVSMGVSFAYRPSSTVPRKAPPSAACEGVAALEPPS
jgi:hypothetical protein